MTGRRRKTGGCLARNPSFDDWRTLSPIYVSILLNEAKSGHIKAYNEEAPKNPHDIGNVFAVTTLNRYRYRRMDGLCA